MQDPANMHAELRKSASSLTRIICLLEADMDDPVVELSDLLLCGAAHPSVMQGQPHMLAELQGSPSSSTRSEPIVGSRLTGTTQTWICPT